MEIQEQLLLAMTNAGKPLKAGELVEICGLTRAEVDKGLNKLKKEERITSPKVCFWEPKK
jgi:chromosome segregation and condensation protein ScpB